jgi:hypothetical protein
MRQAFFAGAHHLFASLSSMFDDDTDEPTAEDLNRLDLIAKEFEAFEAELRRGIPR